MATLGATYVTLNDIAEQLTNTGGKPLVNLAAQTNDIINTMHVQAGCKPDGDVSLSWAQNPSVGVKKYYNGVPSSKGGYTTLTATAATFQSGIEIEEQFAKDYPDAVTRVRTDNVAAGAEALGQQVAYSIFYDAETNSLSKFSGLSTFYNGLTTTTGTGTATLPNPANLNVIPATPTTGTQTANKQTSIWLIGWGPQSIYGFYGKDRNGDITHEFKPSQPVLDSNNNRYWVDADILQWQMGLMVRDWRYGVRICNVDTVLMKSSSAYQAQILSYMIQASERLYSMNNCKPYFYMRRDVRAALRQGVNVAAAYQITPDTVAGKTVYKFGEIPVGVCDQILATEAILT